MSFAERDAMMYKVEGEDLYLIGTSEHSMIGRFIDKNLKSLAKQIMSEGHFYYHIDAEAEIACKLAEMIIKDINNTS